MSAKFEERTNVEISASCGASLRRCLEEDQRHASVALLHKFPSCVSRSRVLSSTAREAPEFRCFSLADAFTPSYCISRPGWTGNEWTIEAHMTTRPGGGVMHLSDLMHVWPGPAVPSFEISTPL